MKNKAAIIKKAKKIKLIACDVDGVLTRGEIIILNNGEEVKILWSNHFPLPPPTRALAGAEASPLWFHNNNF